MRVGRRGRGFCCSVASSAGAGATLRLGPIAAVCRGCPQQRLPRLPQTAPTRSRASLNQLRPPTESAAALLLFFCSKVPPTVVHQPDKPSSNNVLDLRWTQLISMPERSQSFKSRVCIFTIFKTGFSWTSSRARFLLVFWPCSALQDVLGSHRSKRCVSSIAALGKAASGPEQPEPSWSRRAARGRRSALAARRRRALPARLRRRE